MAIHGPITSAASCNLVRIFCIKSPSSPAALPTAQIAAPAIMKEIPIKIFPMITRRTPRTAIRGPTTTAASESLVFMFSTKSPSSPAALPTAQIAAPAIMKEIPIKIFPMITRRTPRTAIRGPTTTAASESLVFMFSTKSPSSPAALPTAQRAAPAIINATPSRMCPVMTRKTPKTAIRGPMTAAASESLVKIFWIKSPSSPDAAPVAQIAAPIMINEMPIRICPVITKRTPITATRGPIIERASPSPPCNNAFIASGFDVTASTIASAPATIKASPTGILAPVNTRIAPIARRAAPVSSSRMAERAS